VRISLPGHLLEVLDQLFALGIDQQAMITRVVTQHGVHAIDSILHQRIVTGYLTWTWENPWKLHEPPSTLCFDFAKLAAGSDEEIRRFAAQWGPLGLRARLTSERVALWFKYARLARAILRFAAEQLTGGVGRDEDWNTICKSTPARSLNRSGLSSERQTAVVGLAVNTWFDKARVHGIVQMVDDQLQVQPRARNSDHPNRTCDCALRFRWRCAPVVTIPLFPRDRSPEASGNTANAAEGKKYPSAMQPVLGGKGAEKSSATILDSGCFHCADESARQISID
jgi:hypothetical protein